ncbi:hypothetical protein EP837_02983 [Sphingobium sp. EP60837]|nr:hypothetical protein EP837_02983 [Sphingobium sp. EP60837]
MGSRCWNYPALVSRIGEEQQPDRAALRVLVQRMRREAFPESSEPALQRWQVRQAVIAALGRR